MASVTSNIKVLFYVFLISSQNDLLTSEASQFKAKQPSQGGSQNTGLTLTQHSFPPGQAVVHVRAEDALSSAVPHIS